MYKTSGITANYSKNSITATTFKGNLEGNALTATTALSCSGNSATATLANEAKNLQNTTPETKDESFFSKVVTEDADMVSFQTLKGNSVVWNQLIKDFREPSNWLTGGNDVTIVGDKIHIKFASASFANAFGVKSSAFLAGHKYCILMNNENAVPLAAIKLGSASSIDNSGSTLDSPKMPLITTAIPTGSFGDGAFWFWASDETKLEGDFSNIYVIDLTQMFGAGNEPTTYEEFLRRKPKVADEYAYNEGTIVNNKVEKVVTTGRNLWDEEWESGRLENGENYISPSHFRSKNFISVDPTKQYFIRATGCFISEYDANKTFIEQRDSFTDVAISLPANCRYIRFWCFNQPTYNHDICINLSDPAINGQYFPYEKHELDLSWVKDIKDGEGVKLFEDGMRSAGTAFDEVGKNKAVKRIEKVVFDGTEDWNFFQKDDKIMPLIPNFFPKRGEPSTIKHCKSNYYLEDYSGKAFLNQPIGTIQCRGDLKIADLWESIEAWEQHLAELYAAGTPLVLYYELAEPIEVELQNGINHTLPVWKDGMMYAESSQSSTPIVCTNAYYTNIRESVKKFIGDADSIYASTSGYNAHGT